MKKKINLIQKSRNSLIDKDKALEIQKVFYWPQTPHPKLSTNEEKGREEGTMNVDFD